MTSADGQAHIEIVCAGEPLWLLAGRAVWWPARRMLLVADIHFGKAASYRVLGQPVPHGTTRDNLDRLDALIARHAPEGIVFLGDFLHAPELRAATGPTLRMLREWRMAHPGLACTLVRGNHDRRAGDPAAVLHIKTVDEPHEVGALALCHHPGVPARGFVLAGHLHPVYTLRGRGRDHLRLPCFVAEPGRLLLPAFGAFTGGYPVDPDAAHGVYVVGEGRIWKV